MIFGFLGIMSGCSKVVTDFRVILTICLYLFHQVTDLYLNIFWRIIVETYADITDAKLVTFVIGPIIIAGTGAAKYTACNQIL